MSKSKKNVKTNQKALLLGTSLGIITLLVASFLWFQSPLNNSNNANTDTTEEIEKVASVVNVSVSDLADAISSETEKDYIIVDVREQWEYDRGHAPGVTLIPLGELEARAAELPNDKTLYIICQSGVRSTQASNMLLNLGKLDIRNVEGGTAAWARAGLPIEQSQ